MLAQEELSTRLETRRPEDAAALLRVETRSEDVETFWVLLLDSKYRLLRAPTLLTRGVLEASLVHPREVFKEAVRTASAAVVLIHNHPSGDPSPSHEDIRITKSLVEASKVMKIEILDHVILGEPGEEFPGGYCSLRESSEVQFE